MIIIFSFFSSKRKVLYKGGNNSDINSACILYVKMQKIGEILKNDQISKTHSTWGESFFYGYANTLLLEGYTNDNPLFPLIGTDKDIYKTLKDISYWSEYGDEYITADKIYDIIKEPPLLDNELKLKIIKLVYNEDINILQGRYPNISRDNIIALLIRHGSPENNENYEKIIRMPSASLSLPPPVYRFYQNTFKDCIECFAGPINHTLNDYCAIFKADKKFGALGVFGDQLVKKYKKRYIFLINPPYDKVSLNLSAKYGIKYPNSRCIFLFPSKDGTLFHMFGKRLIKNKYYVQSRLNTESKEKMNEAIYNIITSKQFSGFIVIPRELMRYYDYGKRETKTITYDTIIMFTFRGKIINDLMKRIYWMILCFGYYTIKERFLPIHGFPQKVIELNDLIKEILHKFTDKLISKKIINSIVLSYNIIEEYKKIIEEDTIMDKMKEMDFDVSIMNKN